MKIGFPVVMGFHGIPVVMGMISVRVGMSKKASGSKISFAIRFIVLFVYLTFFECARNRGL